MKIQRLYAADLFSYENLDLRLADRGLILVEGENRDLGGSNGSGKSNIFKSLCWVLFGKAPQNGETIGADEVIREDESHEPVVGKTVGFVEVGVEEAVLQIFRHRKHAEYGNKVLLYADGNDVTMGTDRETQSRIEDYLGVDYDSFVYSVMFPQDMKGFANLTDAKQKAILDRILGTGRFDRARKKAKEQLGPLVDSLTKLHSKITILRSQLDSRNADLQQAEQQETAWIEDLHRQIQTLRDRQSVIESNPPVLLDDFQAEESRLDELRSSGVEGYVLSDLQAEREDLLRRHATHKSRIDQWSSWRDMEKPVWSGDVPEEVSISELQEEVSHNNYAERTLHGQLAEVQNSHSKREGTADCWECGQALSEQAKDKLFGNLGDRLSDLQGAHAQAVEELAASERRLEEAQEKASRRSAYEQCLADAQTWESIQASVKQEELLLSVIEDDGKRNKEAIDMVVEYDSLKRSIEEQTTAQQRWQDEITQLQVQTRHLQQQQSPYREIQQRAQQNIAQTQISIKTSDALFEKIDQQIGILRFWEEGFGPKGVRSLLLDHITPELNRIANEYLDVLSSGQAKMQFHTTKSLKSGDRRDNFHVEVKYQNGGGSYKKISGGERQRPDLASMFALGDLSASRSRSPINLRLLDEPFDGLDGLGAEQVVQVLQRNVLPKAGTVLVMTHDDNLKQLIDERIVVVKENGVSWIT